MDFDHNCSLPPVIACEMNLEQKNYKTYINNAVFNFLVSLGKMMNPFCNMAFVRLQFCMLWVPGVILAQKSLQLDFI